MKRLAVGILFLSLFACRESNHEPDAVNTPRPESAAALNELDGYTPAPSRAFAVKVVWNNAPVAGTLDNSAELYFVDGQGRAVTESKLTRFRLYMVSMGHPSIKEKNMVLTQVDPGHWTIRNIYFSMGGPQGSWVVDIEASVQGQADKVRVSIDHEVE